MVKAGLELCGRKKEVAVVVVVVGEEKKEEEEAEAEELWGWSREEEVERRPGRCT